MQRSTFSQTGPYIRSGKGISLLVTGDQVCRWPGSTDDFKLSLNYAPGLAALQKTAAMGYQTLTQHPATMPCSPNSWQVPSFTVLIANTLPCLR